MNDFLPRNNLMACPKCGSSFIYQTVDLWACKTCEINLHVSNDVYSVLKGDHYSESFGLQWNRFKKTQLDSAVSTLRSKERFLNETDWTRESLSNKFVLDAGCGAGRFAEVALELGGRVIAVDASSAIYAAQENLSHREALFIQSDIASIPLRSKSVDFIYCIGVLQHTQNPKDIVIELMRILKNKGELVISFYENRGVRTRMYSKYLIRPITKRMPHATLLNTITNTSKYWFPITKYLFSLPKPLGKFFAYILPFANYVNFKYENQEDAKQEAILDTFDMLSPKFDKPIKRREIIKWVHEADQNVIELKTHVDKGTLKFRKS
jgi:2-polyprenyl-3-methyl-5-hydroxy-6-metoxy-1,4-benzoquinol methylase/ribosomal protein S27AE